MGRFLVLLLLLVATATRAATTINVGDMVMVSGVKRFGLNFNWHYYYDRVLLKNLVWRNAGFEGLLFRSMIRCESGTPTGCVDANYFVQWPSGFWNDGTYEFVLGTAKGRSGSIASSTAPPGGSGSGGTTFVFGDSGMTPAAGDYFIAQKYFPGGAEVGWNVATNGGATVTTDDGPAT